MVTDLLPPLAADLPPLYFSLKGMELHGATGMEVTWGEEELAADSWRIVTRIAPIMAASPYSGRAAQLPTSLVICSQASCTLNPAIAERQFAGPPRVGYHAVSSAPHLSTHQIRTATSVGSPPIPGMPCAMPPALTCQLCLLSCPLHSARHSTHLTQTCRSSARADRCRRPCSCPASSSSSHAGSPCPAPAHQQRGQKVSRQAGGWAGSGSGQADSGSGQPGCSSRPRLSKVGS